MVKLLIWLARVVVLVAGPAIAYFQISRTMNAALIGLAFSVAIVIVELLIQSIPLDTLIIGILGMVLGLIAAKLLDYAIYLTGNQKLYEIVREFSLVIKIVFAYLGLMIAVRKKAAT